MKRVSEHYMIDAEMAERNCFFFYSACVTAYLVLLVFDEWALACGTLV